MVRELSEHRNGDSKLRWVLQGKSSSLLVPPPPQTPHLPVKPKIIILSRSLVFAGVFLLETKLSLRISSSFLKFLFSYQHFSQVVSLNVFLTTLWPPAPPSQCLALQIYLYLINSLPTLPSMTPFVDYLKGPPTKPLYPLYFILDSSFIQEYMQLLFASGTCPGLPTVDERHTAEFQSQLCPWSCSAMVLLLSCTRGQIACLFLIESPKFISLCAQKCVLIVNCYSQGSQKFGGVETDRHRGSRTIWKSESAVTKAVLWLVSLSTIGPFFFS